MRKIMIALVALAIAPGCKCGREPKSPEGEAPRKIIVAEFDGGVITRDDLERHLKKTQGTAIIDTSRRTVEIVLSDMLDERLIDLEARKQGYYEREDVREMVRDYERAIVNQMFMKDRMAASEDVGVEEANRYYNSHLEDFEEVRLRDILVRVEPDDQPEAIVAKKKRAEQIRARALKGEDFAELARSFSDDLRTRERGGDTGFVPMKGLPSGNIMMAEVAKLQPGEIGQIVADSSGFHIIQLVERKAIPFERARGVIDAILKQGKRETSRDEIIKELRTRYNAQLFDIKGKNPQSLTPMDGH